MVGVPHLLPEVTGKISKQIICIHPTLLFSALAVLSQAPNLWSYSSQRVHIPPLYSPTHSSPRGLSSKIPKR